MVGVSDNYRRLQPHEVGPLSAELASAWQDPAIPRRQWNGVVRNEVERLRNGHSLPHFDLLVSQLKLTGLDNPTLLEVGASSGFYSEILKILGFQCRYTGVDYSFEYLKLAMELYPDIDFQVADARALPFPDGEFDIVVSGCVILHSAEYGKMISEAARVAGRYVVLNRTPVTVDGPTECYEKRGYGVRMLEFVFSEQELFGIFDSNGLKLLSFGDVPQKSDSAVRYRNYLLSK